MFEKLFPQIMFDADNGGTGGAGEGKVDDPNVDGANAEDTKTEQPLTLDAVQKMIQSETDKVRGEYSKKLKDKEKELEDIRVSSMTEDEKKADALKKATTELEKKQAELTHKELTLNTIDLLKESNLPIEFKDFLIGKDADSTKANVEAFQQVFQAQLEAMVTERFKTTGKEHVESTGKTGRYTQEDLKTMTPDEINANWDKIQRDLSN